MTSSQALEAHENDRPVMWANNLGLQQGRIVDLDVIDGKPAEIAMVAVDGSFAVYPVLVADLFLPGEWR